MSSTRVGFCEMPISDGMEKPWTSASINPTFSPWEASWQARFAVIEDLPTPPLPLATAITRVDEDGSENGVRRLARDARRAARGCGGVTPGARLACCGPAPAGAAVVAGYWRVQGIGRRGEGERIC